MEFIKLLVEREDSKREREILLNMPHLNIMNKPKNQVRFFYPIKITDDILLSAQAGWGFHCYPEETHEDLTVYKSMELGVIFRDELVSVKEIFPTFKNIHGLELHLNLNIYSHVPVEWIEELYQDMKKEWK